MAVSIISQGVYIFVHFCEIDNVCEVFVNMNRSVVPIKLAECNTLVSIKSNKMNYQTILIKRNSNNIMSEASLWILWYQACHLGNNF